MVTTKSSASHFLSLYDIANFWLRLDAGRGFLADLHFCHFYTLFSSVDVDYTPSLPHLAFGITLVSLVSLVCVSYSIEKKSEARVTLPATHCPRGLDSHCENKNIYNNNNTGSA